MSSSVAVPTSSAWLQTFGGHVFDLLNPRADLVFLRDIAHALANLCRFTGHTSRFFSVAEHSVRVSLAVPPGDAVWGLLHDASEAYLVDLPSPVKRHTDVGPPYRALEAGVMAAVCARFGLPVDEPESVKMADARMLATERRDLLGPCDRPWSLPHSPYEERICPLSPDAAESWFLRRALVLGLEVE